MTMRRYETGISENNLRHWGELEAIKEFVQNVVYAKNILGDKIDISYKDGVAHIHNSPSGFKMSKLLIGESEQAGVAGAPGEYGEGMKVAMAVGCRLGLEPIVVTNGFMVKPTLEPSSIDPSVRALVFNIFENDKHGGTSFLIKCSEATLLQAISYFAILTGTPEEDTKKDTIILDTPGSIYVNGVKVTEVPSLFSYNFTKAELMNRDRTTVNMDKVLRNARELIRELDNSDTIEKLLRYVMDKPECFEARVGLAYVSNRTPWALAIREVFGIKAAIATGGQEDTRARYLGFKVYANIPLDWHGLLEEFGIRYTTDLEELAKKTSRKHVKPDAEESATLGWAKRLIKLYYADYGTVRVANNLVDQHGNACRGLYDPKEDIIWLDRDVLDSQEQTFKTLLHETIHKVTGAEDCTAYFERGMMDAAYGILMRGK